MAKPRRGLVFALAFLGTAALAAPTFPALTGRVVDEAGILSPAFKTQLAAQLAAHEQATINQVVVVTLKTLGGYDIADYGYRLGRHWGIGQKGKNNGVLLIVAPAERKVRIEVGYGLEGVLTDAISRDIIERRIKPRFKQGDYDQGVRAGVDAILTVLGGEFQVAAPPVTATGEDNILGPLVGGLLVFNWIFGHLTHRASTRKRAIWSGVAGTITGLVIWFVSGLLVVAIVLAIVVFLFMLLAGGRMGPGSGGYGGWGSGGWGDGSGGGFSGGGGDFGGGGASGDW